MSELRRLHNTEMVVRILDIICGVQHFVAGDMHGMVCGTGTKTMIRAACWRADGAPAVLSGGAARLGSRFRVTANRPG
jgi:hypothetical protein